ncbi:MAG: hypothetical protein DAHOPDDO_02586 [Ignavibacteriaceae bacterium]|nr:hypothetical protein [Ignavibacteriaceae bacterium]
MKSIQQLLYLFVLFLSISAMTFAANWYVNGKVSSSGNGQSWATAWKNFSNISWGSINPGDVIYISGGADSVVYTSGMTIGKSGSAGNYIYIMPGRFSPSPSGHDGKVIIEPSGSAITNSGGYKYIYIKGITIRDFGGRGVYMWNNASHIVLDSLIILNGKEMGTWWEDCSYIEIKNCTVISKEDNLSTDDNNYAQRVHHFYVHHNYFHMRNRQFGTGTDHLDNFQVALWGYAFYFYNNVCITDSAVQGHNIILGCKGNTANYSDTILVFNNFFYDGGDQGCNYQRSVYLRNPENGGNVYQGYVINNTIVTANWGAPCFEGEGSRTYLSNNIMVNMGVNGSTPGSCENGNWTWGQQGGNAKSTRVDSCHTNLAWRAYNSNPSFYGGGFQRPNGTTGSPSSWNDFINNYGGTGVNSNPKFAGNWRLGQYELQSSSPAIDAGTNMLYYLNKYVGYLPGFDPTKDIAGNPRTDSNWDIGCFEFNNGGGGNNPPNLPSNPNPVNGSIDQPVNSSLSWSCTDPNGDPLTYDVYFGTNNNPPLVSSNQSNTSYNPGELNNNTTYYWKIIARDNQGASTSGSIWNFITTGSSNYYVDKNATGQNNGTSWANAWTTLSAINWSSVQPGDVIYISGGTDSTIYSEQLNIETHGSENNYVTVRNSIAAGHNGRVIIDGGFTRNYGVYIEQGCGSSQVGSWLYVKGLEIRRTKLHGVYMHCSVNNIVIDSCKVTEALGRSVMLIGNDDYYLEENGVCAKDIEIKNCYLESHPDESTTENDVVYLQMGARLNIHNNYIHQQNRQSDNQPPNHMHIDCIQTHVVRNINIWNNVCVIDSGVYGHAMILGTQSRSGTIDTSIIYNNYIYGGGHLQPGGNPNVSELYLRWYGYVNSVYPATFVYQNTVVAANGGSFLLYHEMPAIVKNNILIQMGTNGENPNIYGGAGLEAWYSGFNSSWYIKANESTNNLLWSKYSGSLFLGNQFMGVGGSPVGTPSSWSEWVNAYGGIGVNEDPIFVNDVRKIDGFVIGSNSPAINAGADLQAFIESKGLPWSDILGNPRDSSPDLGVYEHDGILDVQEEVTPSSYMLEQNYPNPFNPSTKISYFIPTSSFVILKVYDILGNEIRSLVNEEKTPGNYQLEFNAANLPTGIYFYRLQAGSFIETRKMVMMK